jgi:hypothetical protein
VRTIIESYRNKSKAILSYYKRQGKLIVAEYLNNDVELLLKTVGRELASMEISAVERVPVFFMDGNDEA